MCCAGDQNPTVGSCRKRKRRDRLSIDEAVEACSENSESKKGHKAPAKRPRGPQNQNFNFRGVWQRVWGKWEAEIQAPNGKRLWLGYFPTAIEAAMAYDRAAMKMYGEKAILNMLHVVDSNMVASSWVSKVFAATISESMACGLRNPEIWEENVGGKGDTSTEAEGNKEAESGDYEYMKVTDDMLADGLFLDDIPVDVGGSNEIKAEAEENKETEPNLIVNGAESGDYEYMKVTDDMLADGLFLDDIPVDVGGGNEIKAEAEENKETEPNLIVNRAESGDYEYMKVTEDMLADGLFLDDIPVDVGGSNEIKVEAELNEETEPGEDMKAEAEENEETEQGNEEETDLSLLILELFYDESELFSIDEFLD